MGISDGESSLPKDAVYTAGYRMFGGYWVAAVPVIIFVVLQYALGFKGLQVYLEICRAELEPGWVLSRALFSLGLGSVVLVALAAYSIRIRSTVKHGALLISAEGIRRVSTNHREELIPWASVREVWRVHLSRYHFIVRVVYEGGSFLVHDSMLYDAEETLRLIRDFACLIQEEPGSLWTFYRRKLDVSQT